MMRAISSADFVSKPWDASFWLSVVRCWRREAESVSASSFPWAPAPSCVVVLVNIKVCPHNLLYLQSRQEAQNSARPDCHFNVMSSNQLEGFTNSIMEPRPHLPDSLVLPIRPCPVRQKHRRNRRIQIDPQRASAISQVPNRMLLEALPGRRLR